MVANEVAVASALTQHYSAFLPGATFRYQAEEGERSAEEAYKKLPRRAVRGILPAGD